MNNKKNKVIYSILALLVYVGFMVGLGFILDLFWKVSGTPEIMFWIATAVVCLCVVFYVVAMLCGKDKGVGAIQLFFTICLSCLPLIIRAINLIPYAGIYISIVLLFIVAVLYLITMIAMGYYATDVTNNSDNRPGGKEI